MLENYELNTMKRRLICLLSLISFIGSAIAQPNSIFTHYSSEDGLSENSIMSMAQDQNGFLWFATWDGVDKFDGYDFKVYKTRKGNDIGLSNNRIDLVKVDKYNFVWLLTYDKRVFRLDNKKERFQKITCETENGEMDCMDIRTLPGGSVWALSEGYGAIRAITDKKNYTIKWKAYAINQKDGYKSRVRDIIEDIKGNEWLITDNGLLKICKKSNGVTYYFVERKHVKKENKQSFFSSCMTKNEIYFGSSNGRVWKYSIKNDEFTLITLPLKDNIIAINRLKDGSIVFTSPFSGFIIRDTKSGQDIKYDTSSLKGFEKDQIQSVYVDKHDEIWFELISKGKVSHFNPYNKVFKTENMFVGTKGADRSYPSFHICEDINDNLWVHPNGGGLGWFDRKANVLRPFYNDHKSSDCMFSNKIHSMLADKQGNLWISTHSKGLEKISFYNSQFKVNSFSGNKFDLNENSVRMLFQDNLGRLWVGKRNSKIELYSASNEYIGYLTESGAISKTGPWMDGVAYNIIQDKKGRIWIATKGRGLVLLNYVDKMQYSVTRFEFDSNDIYSLSHNNAYSLYEDRNGRIWVATFGGGLNYIQENRDGKCIFINSRNNLKGYPIDKCYRVRHITSDMKGNIWVSTNDGVIRFKDDFKSPEHIKFYLYGNIHGKKDCLSNSNVYETCVSKKGEVFFATFGGGLNKLISIDKNGMASFKTYTINDGLPSDILLSIEEDYAGNLWFSTENGLCKYYPATNRFENYNERDFGKKIRFEEGTSIKLANNDIIFGTSNGLISFDPKHLYKSTFIPPMVFTNFKVCNKLVIPGDNSNILQNNVNTTDKITLKRDQNIFSLSFAALDMVNSDNIKYAYYLEGFDKDWNYVLKQRTATYTNLSPEVYYLHVKSTNSDGVWVNNERVIEIEVLPSFWETPIAIFLYVIVGLAIFLLSVYILFTIFRLKHEVSVEQKISDIKLRFFTNISHELRTPLTLISGPLEFVLKNKALPDEVCEQLHLVERNSDRMLRLVNQILDFRKIQKNKMTLKVEYINVVPFVRQIMNNFISMAEEHHIDFIFESEKRELNIWVDTDKLEKIVFNLLSNAFKYTPKGKMITLFVHDNENNVAIGVQDQGIGISENKKSSLFVRFESLLDKDMFNQQSSGIGLSLVKELVDIHRANIVVNSKVGVGSTFTVELSKNKDVYDNYAEFILNDGVKLSESEDPDKDGLPACDEIQVNNDYKTMLLVEDNIELRFFLRTIFSSQYNVVEAANGKEGIDKAQKYIPDIIISDVMMPELDGMEMTKALRDNISTSHIPIILLTAKSDMDSKLQGIAEGADDYIIKPFSATYLQARVNNIIEIRSRLQKLYRDTLMNPSSEEDQSDEKESKMSANDRRFMDKLMELMEKNMDNGDLVVDDLVNELAVSRSVFFKKIKMLTGLAPIEFIKEMRIKKAAQLIDSGEYNITQVSYMVGINDPRYFSKCFKSRFGMTPTEYKQKNGL